MARTHLWKGNLARFLLARWTYLPGSMGNSAFPVPIQLIEFSLVSNTHARVVPSYRPTFVASGPQYWLGGLDSFRSTIAVSHSATLCGSIDECPTSKVRLRYSQNLASALQAPSRHSLPPPPTTTSPAGRKN